ncbi:MAG: hypothetical protein ABEJ03_02385 [Candidatus Nanohaloarchaea archaeon]
MSDDEEDFDNFDGVDLALEEETAPEDKPPGRLLTDGGRTEETLEDRHQGDRDRGLLTERDREYLLENGEDEPATRYRIRKRVKNALRDWELVDRCMGASDLRESFRQLFEEDRDSFPPEKTPYQYLVSIGTMVYEALDDTTAGYERFVEDVITEYYKKKGISEDEIDVGVDIEVHGDDAETHKLVSGPESHRCAEGYE